MPSVTKQGGMLVLQSVAVLCCAVLCCRRQMLMASKVPACAQIALDAVYQQDMCVVIGLQSTGEASMTAVRRRVQ